MSDADLEEIRKARLQQLKQQGSQPGGGGDGSQEDERRQQEAAARENILNQILEPSAIDRLGRIRLVKESRATEVENRLIGLARSGQLRQKVTEDQLKDLLSAMSEQQSNAQEKMVITRRKGTWDDEDDDLLDL